MDQKTPEINIRFATAADPALLAELGAQTFSDTFAAQNTAENMAAYLAASFSVQKQAAELVHPNSLFLIAETAGEAVGYARLKEDAPPSVISGSHPIEIGRFYSRKERVGRGVGPALMQACLLEAQHRGCDTIWLDVWEENPRAIAFYRKWGFVEAGTQIFPLGEDLQHDLLMQRPVKRQLDCIALDADDTLWHNETLYSNAKRTFKQILSGYTLAGDIEQAIYQAETQNLEVFGYGIKGYILSMIEAAVELTAGQIQSSDIQKMVNHGKGMLTAKVQLLDQVEETLANLSRVYRLIIITKGDLLDQEGKLARSGIAQYISRIEVVSHKTPQTYADILARNAIDPSHFMMVGNSLKSDILPVIELGGCAVYVPYENTWAHENEIDPGLRHNSYLKLDQIHLLPELVERIT